jgi:hypothetical protein
MSVLKFLKYSTLSLLVALFLASCDKAEDGLISSPETSRNANLLNNFSQSVEDGSEYQDTLDCFTLIYPITIVYPDNSESVVNSDQELDDALDTWFQANEDAEEYPTFKFPIQVTLLAGTVQDVNSEEELEELIYNCYDYEDCEYFDDYEGEIEDLCFDINYPISINFPDGTTESVNSDSTLENLIEQWYMTNGEDADDPSLVYPVDVTLEDGTVQTISTDDELDDLLDECYYDDYDNYDDYGHDGDYDDDCFSFVFPIEVQLPDGSTVSVNSEDDLDDIFDTYFDSVTDTTESYPMLVYPLSVIPSDSTTQQLNSEEELEALFENCFYGDYDDFDFDDLCFEVNYPVTIVFPDGTTAEATDDDEAEDIVEKWYEDNGEMVGDPTLSFPISITKEDGSQETINSEEELEAAIISCYNG